MGPLNGVKMIEIAGIGPVPFCAMMLCDMGAEILRVERKVERGEHVESKYEVLNRGRPSVRIDLKKQEGVEAVLKLVERADVLFEGFRPGVMERLGLGPDVCVKRNAQLIYGRITGWGQDGPLCHAAGHDINYISLSGVLHAIGRPDNKPVPPLNLIGDYAGGGMLLAFGIACALFEAQKSGRGQVVDAAMVDGSAALMNIFFGFWAAGNWSEQRGTNLVDGGAHFYDVYETMDGKWVSIGAIESKFYALLLELAGIDDPDFNSQMDKKRWPDLKKKLEAILKTKTRDEWCKILEGTDACFAPVLSFEECIKHPHNVARKTFLELEGVPQAAPAPRFSRTRPEIKSVASSPGQDIEKALLDWGFSRQEVHKTIGSHLKK